MSKNIPALLLLLCVALASGCHGNTTGQDLGNPGPGNLPVGEAIDANDGRLPPGAAPLESGVEGTLSLSGLTIDDGAVSSFLHGASQLNYGRIQARLIDPEDDILIAQPLDSQGRFRLSITQTLTSAKLQFSIPVVEDVNGDGKGGDVITQLVPVKLRAGSLAQVSLSISSGTAEGQPVFSPPSGPGVEFNDFLLISELSLLDAGGQKDEYYGTFYEGNFVVYDRDGDNVFEPGEDFVADDSDTDGYYDGGDDQFFPPQSAGLFSIEGTIVTVKASEQRITVRGAATGPAGPATDRAVLVPPFVGIEVYSSSLGFLGALSVEQLRPGDLVYVESIGDPAASELIAQWIVVFRP